MIKLSILILSLDCRKHYLKRLLACLERQLTTKDVQSEVEIIVEYDNGERTIGKKRNDVMSLAAGEYICFIDDDDIVAPTYIADILKALKGNPDTVGFKVERKTDGNRYGIAIHSLRFERNAHKTIRTAPGRQKQLFERVPNHLNPIRSSIAKQVGFDDKLNTGEDIDYAERCRPLLKTEVFIDELLYVYEYRTNRQDEVVNKAMSELSARDKAEVAGICI